MLIQRRFIQHANTKRWFWIITVVATLLLGFGIGQMAQFKEATAESQADSLAQLAAELESFKAEHRKLQAKWQSELLAQVAPTLTDEREAVKRQFVDFPRGNWESRDRCTYCNAPRFV